MKPTVTFLKFIMSPLSISKRNKGSTLPPWPALVPTEAGAERRNLKSKIRGMLILCLLLLLFVQTPVLAQSQSEDTLLFREGEILLSKGESEKALWRFKRLITEFPKSSLSNEAKFRMGICYTQLKKPNEAIQILNELFSTFLSPSRMIQVFTLLGDNSLELKDPLTALHWYGKGLLIPGQPQEELKKKVRFVIDTFDTEEEFKKIESLYRGAYGGGYAKLKLAQLMKGRGNDFLAKRLLNEWAKEYPNENYGLQAKELLEWYHISGKSPYTIGVILPLSDIYQPFGERVLQAIQLAMKEMEVNGKNPPLVSLAIRDSKGNPLEAEKAVEELVNEEKVIAIVGPLLTITVDLAAKKAQELKVPLLTLSQIEPLYGQGEFVFQNSLTPSEQIQTLVAYAIKELELRTFAIFYPISSYGLFFKNLFTQEVVQKGGNVLGVVGYHEDQTDFSQEIKDFFKIKRIEKTETRGIDEEEYEMGFSVDSLFIPDTHDRVGLILSQLAYFDVSGLTFLGTNAWNGPSLIPIAGKSAEGAIFVDTFFNKAPSPLIARFVKEFRQAYQRDPETLEALSYDGVKLLLETIKSKGISSPIQMRDEIRKVQNFQGVSGLKGFGEGGKTIRTLFILKVIKGQIKQVSPQ
jgi:branched-chain amino acid transport system substrate-binding protein